MQIPRGTTIALSSELDLLEARRLVREAAQSIGLSLVEVTKLVTAASELARNALVHGGGGRMHLHVVSEGLRRGVRVVFEDQGPGIPDVQLALQDGYTTAGGLGLGLSGARRLVNDFQLESDAGRGTKVTIARWSAR